MVEARPGRQVRRPHLGRVAHGQRPRLPGDGGPQLVLARAFEAGQVGGQALGQSRRRRAAEAFADRGHARGREQELRRGQEHGPLHLAGRPLVGRIERPQRIDLVAEELDADRQRHRWREHVDDAAAPGELATTGHLGDRAVPEVEQVAQQRVQVEPGARPQLAWRRRQVVRGDGVLEQRLDARDEDPRGAAPPRRQRGDPCRGLVRDELAAFVGEGGPRLQDRYGGGIAEPRPELLCHAIADLRVAGDPDERLADRRWPRRGYDFAP